MSRRQFISAAIIFVTGWVTGLGRKELRRLFARAMPYEEPLGFLDAITSSSVHGLNTSSAPNWEVAYEKGPRVSFLDQHGRTWHGMKELFG